MFINPETRTSASSDNKLIPLPGVPSDVVGDSIKSHEPDCVSQGSRRSARRELIFAGLRPSSKNCPRQEFWSVWIHEKLRHQEAGARLLVRATELSPGLPRGFRAPCRPFCRVA